MHLTLIYQGDDGYLNSLTAVLTFLIEGYVQCLCDILTARLESFLKAQDSE